jgi:hypothetical protein
VAGDAEVGAEHPPHVGCVVHDDHSGRLLHGGTLPARARGGRTSGVLHRRAEADGTALAPGARSAPGASHAPRRPRVGLTKRSGDPPPTCVGSPSERSRDATGRTVGLHGVMGGAPVVPQTLGALSMPQALPSGHPFGWCTSVQCANSQRGARHACVVSQQLPPGTHRAAGPGACDGRRSRDRLPGRNDGPATP